MRPIGFEPPKHRLRQALIVGAATAGAGALAALGCGFGLSNALEQRQDAAYFAALVGAIGFGAGFLLRLSTMDRAPAQPADEGGAEAGVPARLIPPAPVVSGRMLSGE